MAPSAASAASGLRRALQGTCVMHDGLDIRGYDWEIHNIQRMKRKRLDMDVEVGRAEEGDFEAHCLLTVEKHQRVTGGATGPMVLQGVV